jgi:prepilin signal peptidase PulO-like enzyme (type II secretory pathway)
MTFFFLIAVLTYSLFILALLFHIDLRTRLLPNRYVLQLFFAGLAFHIASGFNYNPFFDLLIASISGSGLLFAIRSIGNRLYGFDTLGMGDVKLIGAAGIWLGSEYIFLAITLGALMGVLHGLGIVFYSRFWAAEKITLNSLSIPAGPGFIVGIVMCAVLKYYALILGIHGLF